jgi:hypothetical protein
MVSHKRAARTSANSFTVTNVAHVPDADGRDTLRISLHTGEQVDIPLINCTASKLREITLFLQGREFTQQRPELNPMCATKMATFETIYPYDALRALTHAFNQRALRMDRVEQYAHEMRTGNWLPTGQGLSFDITGRLDDGQHRLWGCILANSPFETLVVRGLSPDARFKVDIQAARDLACLFEMDPAHTELMRGLPSARRMRGWLFRIFMLIASKHKNIWIGSQHNLPSMIRKYRPSLEWIQREGLAETTVSPNHKSAPILAGMILFHARYPREAAQFAAMVYSVENKKTAPAARALFDYLHTNNKRATVRTDSILVQTYRVLHAAEAFVRRSRDVNLNDYPKTLEARRDLLAFFSRDKDPRSLLPMDIDLESFNAMLHEHQTRAREATTPVPVPVSE